MSKSKGQVLYFWKGWQHRRGASVGERAHDLHAKGSCFSTGLATLSSVRLNMARVEIVGKDDKCKDRELLIVTQFRHWISLNMLTSAIASRYQKEDLNEEEIQFSREANRYE